MTSKEIETVTIEDGDSEDSTAAEDQSAIAAKVEPSTDQEASATVEADNEDGDEDEAEEYNVEEIRARRMGKNGAFEYLIKWENYPETDNTWEPQENLNCPELIVKFNDQQKAKRKPIESKLRSTTKRAKKLQDGSGINDGAGTSGYESPSISTRQTRRDPLLEEDQQSDSTQLSDGTKERQKEVLAEQRPKGFDRGLPIEQIIGACTDSDDTLWFFIKWEGLNELDLVEASELEDRAPKDLCNWYKDRLYYTVKNPPESEMRNQLKV